jgi:hypothetical protein
MVTGRGQVDPYFVRTLLEQPCRELQRRNAVPSRSLSRQSDQCRIVDLPDNFRSRLLETNFKDSNLLFDVISMRPSRLTISAGGTVLSAIPKSSTSGMTSPDCLKPRP